MTQILPNTNVGGCLEHAVPKGRGCDQHKHLAKPCGCTPYWHCDSHLSEAEEAAYDSAAT